MGETASAPNARGTTAQSAPPSATPVSRTDASPSPLKRLPVPPRDVSSLSRGKSPAQAREDLREYSSPRDEPAQDGALTKKRSAQSAELPEEEESSSESESSEEEKKRKAKEKKKKRKKLGYGDYSQMMVMNQMMGMSMMMNNPLAMSMMNNPMMAGMNSMMQGVSKKDKSKKGDEQDDVLKKAREMLAVPAAA